MPIVLAILMIVVSAYLAFKSLCLLSVLAALFALGLVISTKKSYVMDFEPITGSKRKDD